MCCKGLHIDEKCLSRICDEWKEKKIQINKEYGENKLILFEQWITKKCEVISKGKKILCQKTIKVTVIITKNEVIPILKTKFIQYMKRIAKMRHQYKTMLLIKDNLKENSVLIQANFSEN